MVFKSNRKFLYRIFIPCFCVFLILTILLGIGFIFTENFHNILISFVVCLIFSIITLIPILITRFLTKPTFIFEKECIHIHKKTSEETLHISNIKSMVYYRFRWYYIISMFFQALPEGGCMKIHIYDNFNNKYLIGFLSQKQAQEIKNIYPNLMEIK